MHESDNARRMTHDMLDRELLAWPPVHLDPSVRARIDAALHEGRPSAARRLVGALQRELTWRTVRVAVLRTFSLELGGDFLTLAFARLGVWPELVWLDYDAFEVELASTDSALWRAHRDRPFDFVVLAWRLPDWVPAAWNDPTGDHATATAAESAARAAALVARAAELTTVLCFPFDDHGADAVTPQACLAQRQIIHDHAGAMLAASRGAPDRIAVVDVLGPHLRTASPRPLLDAKSRAVANQPYSRPGQVAVAMAVARAAAPWLHAPAKVLLLDADNTLWGGVIGEDGIDGVHIGHDFPGKLYRQLQATARALMQRGVLLVLVSKNDDSLVREMFAANPDMPLGLDDFTAVYANWDEKAANIERAAAALNLGLDSFVFLDDSPFERANVRARLPQVRVPETGDVVAMLDYLRAGYDFLTLPQTAEDTARTRDYAAQSRRDALRDEARSVEEFLTDLQLRAHIAPLGDAAVGRVAQMLKKTNQFNLTTRRHGLARVTDMAASDDWVGLSLRARDRFADQGIVGVALAERRDHATWEIDSFLLSCRALGRGFETALFCAMADALRARGAEQLICRYIATAKNGQTREFYGKMGAELVDETATERVYRLDVTGFDSSALFPAWITRDPME